MEVNATTFRHDLLDILVSIAEADFVSFDLELSGIPSRQQRRSPNAGRHTLEERYLEAREGANKHQILQVGFTCARFDYIENRYILKPYNVNLSPLLEDRLGIDREFSFQTGSISFLLACGFRMDAPFTEGVQYLSREEAELVKQREFDRIDDKNEYQDLQLKRTDIESLGFLDRVRRAIEGWKKSKSPFLEITTRTGLDGPPEVAAITKFEKRLVYQLIRAEYQDLKAIGRTHSMKIFYYDEQREEENRKWQKTRVKEQIMRQTGFRWVIEALTGDGVDLLDPRYFERSRSGEAISDLENIKGKFDRAKIKLQTHQPVLVGHNMFTDIVYLYRCFIGELPPTLGEFCEALHELFPRIVDTKYLATHDEGDLNASPTLERIDTLLSSQELPDISIHKDHSKYDDAAAYHEAGYDSLLTARIMLRLSAKLGLKEGLRRNGTDAGPLPNGSGNNSHRTRRSATPQQLEPPNTPESEAEGSSSAHPELVPVRIKPKKKAHRGIRGKRKSANWFVDPSEHPSELENPWEGESFGISTEYRIDTLERKPMEMMPEFDSEFWHRFGNRLRVFGTQESLLHIAEWEKPPKWNESRCSSSEANEDW